MLKRIVRLGTSSFFVLLVLLSLAFQFLSRAYAMELCEPQDYYNLANATNCPVQDNKADNKEDPREVMFQIMKNYPFENKDAFVKLLQRKIELVDTYKTQQQGARQSAALGKLEQAKQVLLGQVAAVDAATRDNWASVRDQARTALEETARSLREVE